MQLSLARKETTSGLFRKTTHYVITSKLLTSEAERHAIATLGLDDKYVFQPYEFQKLEYASLVSWWLDDGLTAAVADLLKAHALEAEIKDIARQIKENVDAFLDSGAETTKSQVIEL